MGTGTAATTAMRVANTQMKANFSRQVHVGALPFKNVARRGQVARKGGQMGQAYGALEIRQMLFSGIGTLLSIK